MTDGFKIVIIFPCIILFKSFWSIHVSLFIIVIITFISQENAIEFSQVIFTNKLLICPKIHKTITVKIQLDIKMQTIYKEVLNWYKKYHT